MPRLYETKDLPHIAGFRPPESLADLNDRLDQFDDEVEQLSARVQDGRIDSRPMFSTRSKAARLRDLINRNIATFLEPIAAERRGLHASEQRAIDRGVHLRQRLDLAKDGIAILEGQIANQMRRFADPATDAAVSTGSAGPGSLPSLGQYHEAKANRIGADPEGGYLVADEHDTQITDRLRATAVILQAGPRVVQMNSEIFHLPRLTTSATAYAIAEAATITASSPAFGLTSLYAKAYAARSIGSVEWFDDSAVDARAILADDLSKQLGLKADHDWLQGDGTSTSPLVGLRNTAGVTVTTLGSGAGATPTFDNLQDAIARMRAANATPACWFANPRTMATLRKIKTGIASDTTYVYNRDPSAAGGNMLFGLPVFESSQISIAETVGGSSDCSSIFLADMTQVVVGVRGGVRVLYDEYTYASSRQVQVVMSLRVGFGVLNVAGVEVIAGVRP